MSEVASIAGMLVRAVAARRVLEVGTGGGDSAAAIASGLPADGMLITLERDPVVAEGARQRLAAEGYADRVSVMIGEASRFLHKVAGPFNLIVQDGDPGEFDKLHNRLVQLLAPSGTLVTHNTRHAASYNELLSRDARLSTITLNIGNGVAISVLRGNDHDA